VNKGKRVLKYGTGDVIPSEAVYLCTKVEATIESHARKDEDDRDSITQVQVLHNTLVWHYYEVDA